MKSNRVIIVSTVFIVAVVSYLAFNLYQIEKEAAVAQFQEHQLLIARMMAAEIEAYLNDRSQGIQTVSTLAPLQYLDIKETQEIVNSYFERIKTKYVKSVSVYDKEGTIIYSTNHPAVGRNYETSNFFIWAKKEENKGKVYISSLIRIQEGDKEPPPYFRFLLAAPLYQEVEDKRYPKPSKKFIGVFSVSVDLQELLNEVLLFVKTNSKPINSCVIDKNGTLLFSSEHPEMTLRNIRKTDETCSECHSSFEYAEQLLTSKQGTLDYQLKNFPKKLAAFAPVEYGNMSWIVVVNTPYDKVIGSVGKIILLLSGVLIVVLIGGSAMLYRNNLLQFQAKEEAKHWRIKREMEEEIQLTKNYLESILNNSLDLIFTVKKDGTFDYINPQLENITGYSKEQIVGKSFMNFIPARRKEFILEKWREINAGISGTYETEIIKADGSLMYCLISYSVLEGFEEFLVILKDITERKRAEEALKESEKKYRELFEKSEDAILIISNGKFVDCNQATVKMLRYNNKEELLNTHPSELSPEMQPDGKKSYEKADEMMRIAFEKGSHRFEWDHKKADGEVFPVEVLLTAVIIDSENKILHTVWRDITERKRAEETLRMSEAKYRSIFENATEGIFQSTPDGHLLSANNALVRMLGYESEEELKRVDIAKDVYANNAKREIIIQKIEKEGVLKNQELILKRKDGTIINVLENVGVVRDQQGSVLYYEGILTDITDQKLAEEALRSSEERFRNLVENINDIYYVCDSQGRLRYGSPNLFSQSGYQPKELLGQSYVRLIAKEDRSRVVKFYLQGEKEGKQDLVTEFRARRKNGELKWMEQATRIVRNQQGEVVEYRCVVRDITERKRVEEALIAAKAKAEVADNLKSEFLAQMSHEIRSPLNVLLNMSVIIKEELKEKYDVEIERYVSAMHVAGNRIIRTIELILHMSELQTGTYEAKFKKVDLYNDVIISSIHKYQPLASAKNLELRVNKNTDQTEIEADEYSVSQIIANLIDNAVKYTQAGGVEVSVYNNEKNKLCVDVADTGIGISEEFIPYLFLPFSQEQQGYTRRFEGNGLGLALVKKCCDVNNAEVFVNSKKDFGSTFTVIFN